MTLRRAVSVEDRSLTGVGSKCSGFKYKVKWGQDGVGSRWNRGQDGVGPKWSVVKVEWGQGGMGSRWSGFKLEWGQGGVVLWWSGVKVNGAGSGLSGRRNISGCLTGC